MNNEAIDDENAYMADTKSMRDLSRGQKLADELEIELTNISNIKPEIS